MLQTTTFPQGMSFFSGFLDSEKTGEELVIDQIEAASTKQELVGVVLGIRFPHDFRAAARQTLIVRATELEFSHDDYEDLRAAVPDECAMLQERVTAHMMRGRASW